MPARSTPTRNTTAKAKAKTTTVASKPTTTRARAASAAAKSKVTAKAAKPAPASSAVKSAAKSAVAKSAVKSAAASSAAKSVAASSRSVKSAKPAAAGPTKSAKSAAKSAPKTAKSAAKRAAASPRELVRPLIRVRQMRAFTSKPVTQAELEAITEVARWTGSSRNEQVCRFIVLRNRGTIQKIAELGLPQTRGLPTAPAAIAIVEPDEPEREPSRAFDDGRAAERILIAANMLGLGGGISRVRPDVRAGIDRVLKVPPKRSVRTIVAIGHPTEDALAPKSKPGTARLPREEVIFEEHWPES